MQESVHTLTSKERSRRNRRNRRKRAGFLAFLTSKSQKTDSVSAFTWISLPFHLSRQLPIAASGEGRRASVAQKKLPTTQKKLQDRFSTSPQERFNFIFPLQKSEKHTSNMADEVYEGAIGIDLGMFAQSS